MIEASLLELVNLTTGKLNSNAAIENGKYPFFTCSPITSRINDYAFDTKALILAGNNADGNFSLKYYSGKFNAYQRTYILTLDDEQKTTYSYLYYFLKTKLIELKNNSAGSATKFLTLSILRDIRVLLPQVSEQKAIASVLSSLDDKIDLLHRQNKTLESMAETLFRQWFIEECDNKWPLVLLGDFISCVNGASYKSSELLKSQKALVTLKNFARDGSFKKDGFKEYVGHYKHNQVVVDKDIVVAHTDLTQDASLIGNPIYVRNIIGYDILVISMDLVKVELNSELLSKDFLFYLLKSSEFKDYALSCSNGSSVIHLSKKALPNYTFNLPPYERIASFSVIAESYYEKMSINTKSIQTLETLRDTLLPKLMSGEVRVKYAEESIASVA